MILKAKHNRTKLINRLSLPPLYALMAFILIQIFEEFLFQMNLLYDMSILLAL